MRNSPGFESRPPGNRNRDAEHHPKYLIHLDIVVNGHVDDSDVIGALFGQLEGLIGPELELRELQRTGKIGRIKVHLKNEGAKTRGVIQVGCSLDKARTAIIAAAMESVDRVGPYTAKVKLRKITDEREEKRRFIAKRAVEILKEWRSQAAESSKDLLDKILREASREEVVFYGPERLPAGPGVDESEELIVVEGRADVVNMLRYGWTNVISVGGAVERVPDTVVKLIAQKDAIAFVDGDRGGEMVLRALLEQTDVDYVARAPPGKGVQDLTAKEIRKALESAVPASEERERMGIPKPVSRPPPPQAPAEIQQPQAGSAVTKHAGPPPVEELWEKRIPKEFRDWVKEAISSGRAILLSEDMKKVKEVRVSDLHEQLDSVDGAKYLVYDGNVTQRIVDKAHLSGIRVIVGRRTYELSRIPVGLKVYTLE